MVSVSRKRGMRALVDSLDDPDFLALFACSTANSGLEWVQMMITKGKLTIDQVSRSNAGEYRCHAENGIEPAITTDFELQVSGTSPSTLSVLDLPAKGPVLGP